MKIRSLPSDVAAKLRTGISITDVVHCIEELVWNSIDANSTCIAVRLNLPYYKIQVVDNGEGIPSDQMNMLGERYATSKCFSLKDLKKIKTGGFRGEALASLKEISSIMVIESRHKNSTQTYSKMFTQGNAKEIQKSVSSRASQGTTVTLHDFLFNMPVRKQCIIPVLDLENCGKSLEKMAIMYPHVSFSLKDDATGTIFLETRKCTSVRMAFRQVYGRGKTESLREINFQKDGYELSGLIGLEGHMTKDLQLFYVNKRVVSRCKLHKLVSAMLHKVVLRQRESKNLPKVVTSSQSPVRSHNCNGIFVLNLSCSYDHCDVTVQPRKTIVVFANEGQILDFIDLAVVSFFRDHDLLPDIGNDQDLPSSDKKTKESDSDSLNDTSIHKKVQDVKTALFSLPAKRPIRSDTKPAAKKVCSDSTTSADSAVMNIEDDSPESLAPTIMLKPNLPVQNSLSKVHHQNITNCSLEERVKSKANKESIAVVDDQNNHVSTSNSYSEFLEECSKNIERNFPEILKDFQFTNSSANHSKLPKTIAPTLKKTRKITIPEKVKVTKTVSRFHFGQGPNSELFEKFKRRRKEETLKQPVGKSSKSHQQSHINVKPKHIMNCERTSNHYNEYLDRYKSAKDFEKVGIHFLGHKRPSTHESNHVRLKEPCLNFNQPSKKSAYSDLLRLASSCKQSSQEEVNNNLKTNDSHHQILTDSPTVVFETFQTKPRFTNSELKSPVRAEEFVFRKPLIQNTKLKLKNKSDLNMDFHYPPLRLYSSVSTDKETDDNFHSTRLNRSTKKVNFNLDDIAPKSPALKSPYFLPFSRSNPNKTSQFTSDFSAKPKHDFVFKSCFSKATSSNSQINNYFTETQEPNPASLQPLAKKLYVENWLKQIHPFYSPHSDESSKSLNSNDKLEANTSANTIEKCIQTTPTIESEENAASNSELPKYSEDASKLDENQLALINMVKKAYPLRVADKPHRTKSMVVEINNEPYEETVTLGKVDMQIKMSGEPSEEINDNKNDKVDDDNIKMKRFDELVEKINDNDENHDRVDNGDVKMKRIDELSEKINDDDQNDKGVDDNIDKSVICVKFGNDGMPSTMNDDFLAPDLTNSEENTSTHFFLTRDASQFVGPPISLKLQQQNDEVSSDFEKQLQKHLSEQEEFNANVKWREKPSATSDLIASWENPMFKRPFEVNRTTGLKETQTQKIARSVLSLHCYSKKIFTSIEVIGQADKKFIVCLVHDFDDYSAGTKMLVLFDQHAVHERIMLEKLTEELYETNQIGEKIIKSSVLQPPMILTFNARETRLLKNYRECLQKVGVTLLPKEESGAFEIHSIPACLVNRVNKEAKKKSNSPSIVQILIEEWLIDLQEMRSPSQFLPKTLKRVLNSQACRGSVKFGDALELSECEKLIKLLSYCNFPFQCAHGRPSIAPLLDLKFLEESETPSILATYEKLLKARGLDPELHILPETPQEPQTLPITSQEPHT